MKTKKGFAYLILHYMAPEVTHRCLRSVRSVMSKTPGEDIAVVVDNGSPDGSGAELARKWKEDRGVLFIASPENLGFSAGNNLGWRLIRERFEPEFVVVLNNDVLLTDPLFEKHVRKIYEASPFAVLGPDVTSAADGRHLNPKRPRGRSLSECTALAHSLRFRRKYPLLAALGEKAGNGLHFLRKSAGKCKRSLLEKIPGRMARDRWKQSGQKGKKTYESACTGTVLNGSCLIFSADFLKRREKAFYPETFLYLEEDLLWHTCREEGLIMRYDPAVTALHLEDRATIASEPDGKKRAEKKASEMERACRVLFRYLREANR